jgi:hypothetical protein
MSHNMGDIGVQSEGGGWLDMDRTGISDLIDKDAQRKAKETGRP